MYWNKNIGEIEYWFFCIFGIIYFIYLVKVFYVSNKMKLSARAVVLKILPRLVCFTLLIISLLEPSFGKFDKLNPKTSSSRIIYFLSDVSKSMDAADIVPSRLEVAKQVMGVIGDYFVSDKIGIIAFAAQAAVQSPLTSDNSSIHTFINSLNTNLFAESGTNLAGALELAINKIESSKLTKNTSAILVAFTDGEDFSDIDDRIINDLKRKRIKLILIGVGSLNGSKIYNEKNETIKDNNAVDVISKLQPEYLKTIANHVSGDYFEIIDSKNQISDIIKKIEAVKGNFISGNSNTANPSNKYHYSLLLAFVLVLLDLIFTIRIFNFSSHFIKKQ